MKDWTRDEVEQFITLLMKLEVSFLGNARD